MHRLPLTLALLDADPRMPLFPITPSVLRVGAYCPPELFPPSPPSCASNALPDLAAPVLNLDRNGQPLMFRSALAGLYRSQWIVSDLSLILATFTGD